MRLFCLLIILNSTFAFSQVTDYRPMWAKVADSTKLFSTMHQQYEKDVQKVEELEHADEIKKIYKNRVENLKNKVRNDNFVFDERLNPYITGIYKELIKGNPELGGLPLRIFVSRSPVPNAYCVGEGSFVINMGLLRRLENESQLAFVIGHEIAHYILDHVNDNIERNVEALQKIDKRLKEGGKDDYGQKDRIEKAIRDIAYNSSRYSRSFEVSADSLGLIYVNRSNYSGAEALKALAILDEIDKEKYKDPIPFQQIFDAEEYPFKDYWIKKQTGGLSGGNPDSSEEGWDRDSLKTHPDCQDRIQLIKSSVTSDGQAYLQEASVFKKMVEDADFEIIQAEYDFGDIGHSLFHALQLLEVYPQNAYLRTMVSKNLMAVYTAQSNHYLSKILDFPSKYQEDQYELLLTFVRNLRLKDIKNLNYYFLQKEKDKFSKNQAFLNALKEAEELMEE